MGSCMSSTQAVRAGNVRGKQMNNGSRRQRKKELRRQALETLSMEAKNDELLATISGRTCSNGASNISCIYTQQGRKGTNQDAMIVWEDFASMEDTVYCGVYDGHGPFGHLVARRVRDSLPSKLFQYWQEELAVIKEDSNKEESESDDDNNAELCETTQTDHGSNVSSIYESAIGDVDESDRDTAQSELSEGGGVVILENPPPNHNSEPVSKPPMFAPWKQAHLTAYQVMDKELQSHPLIDCFCSGTTAVTVLKQGKHLVIGNVGDSRAIMGTRDENGILKAIQLTVDLKPNLPQEADRIREYKGRVFALHDEPEVSRVWLPYDDSPGLAMARAFGDFCLKDYGVISVPEMSYRQLTERDLFIVLASDGIWDVLSNDEVVHIVASAPTRSTAARALVESAVRVWRLKYPTSKVDDCAVVCLYLDDPDSAHEHATGEDISSVLSGDSDPFCESHNPVSAESVDLPVKVVNPQTAHVVSDDGELEVEETALPPVRLDPPNGTAEVGEILNEEPPKEIVHSESRRKRSLADWLGADEDEEWSALEGVTRVNSLLNLPRFSARDKRAAGTTKVPTNINAK
ncbi:hypothetical protein CY35_15G061100 [Sphagnum magellanicum]|nr:hypothetical protein CY35_15G061100 [Sphagnum magellanicum]KAH9539513.1 hypothetical protein CY35_15G061100 [Sphagnum magellanicum]KAH9539514.1 hypothetical protein CY35_15G061100 [Sphagnum magellanicum]